MERAVQQQYSRNLLKVLPESEDISDVYKDTREHEGTRTYDADGQTSRCRKVGQGLPC